jgi:hypothetical protein
LVIGLAALAGGCQPSVTAPPPIEPDDPTPTPRMTPSDARWPFWPVKMRIHPLTRVVADDDSSRLVIEARIELRDQHNHTTKGYGQVRFDLFDGAAGSAEQTIEEWNEDLRDLNSNRLYYDDVTRTYLFRLGIDPADLPPEPVLRAYYYVSADEYFSSTYELRR